MRLCDVHTYLITVYDDDFYRRGTGKDKGFSFYGRGKIIRKEENKHTDSVTSI